MGLDRDLLLVSLVVVSGGGWSSVSSLLKRVCLSDNLSCSLGSLEAEEVRSFVTNFFSDCSNDDTEDGNGRDGPSLRGKIEREIIHLSFSPFLLSLTTVNRCRCF